MTADATTDNVMAAFDAYDDAIANGDVISVDVTLDGPKEATLAAGEDIHVSRTAVTNLVAAQADPAILRYRHEAYPSAPPSTSRSSPPAASTTSPRPPTATTLTTSSRP